MLKSCVIGVLLLALYAVCLSAVMMAAAAQAHTVPMADIKLGIERAVADRLAPYRVIANTHDCRRLHAHAAHCQVRAYTLPDRTRWCGDGTAKWVRRTELRVQVMVLPCGPDGGR